MVRLINTKTRHIIAAFKACDLAEVAKKDDARTAFAKQTCEVFGRLTASGVARKNAISARNKVDTPGL